MHVWLVSCALCDEARKAQRHALVAQLIQIVHKAGLKQPGSKPSPQHQFPGLQPKASEQFRPQIYALLAIQLATALHPAGFTSVLPRYQCSNGPASGHDRTPHIIAPLEVPSSQCSRDWIVAEGPGSKQQAVLCYWGLVWSSLHSSRPFAIPRAVPASSCGLRNLLWLLTRSLYSLIYLTQPD